MLFRQDRLNIQEKHFKVFKENFFGVCQPNDFGEAKILSYQQVSILNQPFLVSQKLRLDDFVISFFTLRINTNLLNISTIIIFAVVNRCMTDFYAFLHLKPA